MSRWQHTGPGYFVENSSGCGFKRDNLQLRMVPIMFHFCKLLISWSCNVPICRYRAIGRVIYTRRNNEARGEMCMVDVMSVRTSLLSFVLFAWKGNGFIISLSHIPSSNISFNEFGHQQRRPPCHLTSNIYYKALLIILILVIPGLWLVVGKSEMGSVQQYHSRLNDNKH